MAEPRILMSLRLPPPLYERLHRTGGTSMNAIVIEAVTRLLDELDRLENDGHERAG